MKSLLSIFLLLYSALIFAQSNVIVTVPDSSEAIEKAQENANTVSQTAPPTQESISQCTKIKTDYCVDTLCRHTGDKACHTKCQKHAAAKCNLTPYNQDAQKKSNSYDKVMNVADTLNDCITACSKSSERNCSNQCKEKAKKAVGNK